MVPALVHRADDANAIMPLPEAKTEVTVRNWPATESDIMQCTKPAVTDATAAIRTAEPEILPCPEPEILPCPEQEILPCPEPEILPCPEPEILPCPEQEILPCPEHEILPCPEPEILPCPEQEILPCPEPKILPCPEPEILLCPEPGEAVTNATNTITSIQTAEPEIVRCSPVVIVEDVKAPGRTDESNRPHKTTSQSSVLSFAAACRYMYFFFDYVIVLLI